MINLRQTQGATGDSAISRFDAHTPYEVFEREHRLLREGVAALRSALLSDKFSGSARLGEQVDAVRSKLAVHFAFEEDYGFKHYLQLL